MFQRAPLNLRGSVGLRVPRYLCDRTDLKKQKAICRARAITGGVQGAQVFDGVLEWNWSGTGVWRFLKKVGGRWTIMNHTCYLLLVFYVLEPL